jgi:peptidoglycan/xylan/chitin deacetylase (PgdA/CDA1 family)
MNKNIYANYWRQALKQEVGLVKKSRKEIRELSLNILSIIDKRNDKDFVRCLYCHNVFDDQIEDFEKIIKKLKEIGQFIDTDTCVKFIKNKINVQGRYFHLSFDDGFKNNVKNALPILIKHNVPAIYFVPSSLMGVGWDVEKNYCLNTTKYGDVIELMNVSDLKKILECGYEVGSHTRTHARLSSISTDVCMLEKEIIGSKNDLENMLGIECKYISWPYGTTRDFDKVSMKTIEQAGYHACFGAFRGTIEPSNTSVFTIPRHHFEPHWPLRHVEYFARGNFEKDYKIAIKQINGNVVL